MDLGIAGRVALVTGASRGIGRGIAAALAAEDARVAMSARSSERIETAASELGARAFVHDSADVEGAPALVDAVEAELGPVDILVTNTGGPPPGADPLGFERRQWDEAYRSLVLTPMALVERVVHCMRERRFGRILSVASVAVREPIPALMLSNVHRSGLLAGLKTVAREVAGEGVTVNSLLPGNIGTDRVVALAGSREAAERGAAEQVPAGRLGTVEEIAAVGAFLCSARASYVTGVAVPVDGGSMRSV